MKLAKKLATYDDLLALPEDARFEVLGGELVAMDEPLRSRPSS